jgi:hypothetical protein
VCNAFSCVLLKSGEVLWEAGIDSHDKLLAKHNIVDDTSDGDLIKFARIEITPDDGYLHPEGKWELRIDENTTPRWITPKKKEACWGAFELWKQQVYSKINLEEARNLINPFALPKRTPTAEDIELLHKWATVWDTVRNTIRAYTGSLFKIDKWGDYPEGVYPFQPAVDLWKRGLVASYDGTTWRLHSGIKGEIVYEEKLK